MDFLDEQNMELEALASIFAEDYELMVDGEGDADDRPTFQITFRTDGEGDGAADGEDAPPVSVILRCTFPEEYPSVLPELSILAKLGVMPAP